MRENSVRTLWKQGKAAINAWVHIPSPYAVEIVARQGYDAVTLDMQHGPIDYETAVTMIQVISSTNAAPWVRVPWNEPSIVGRVLDAGAYGVICPMVNNRKECEQFVGACKYVPVGYRSNGAYRAGGLLGGDTKQTNAFTVAMAMIETREAFENLEDILDTPGLDAIYVGPSDLSLSMYGYAAADHSTKPMLGHIEHIAKRARAKGKPAGLFCLSTKYARRAIGMGYNFININADDMVLGAKMGEDLKTMRAGR